MAPHPLSRTGLAAALAAASFAAAADEPIVITARGERTAQIAGFGGAPIAETPISASVFDASTFIRDRGYDALAGLVQLDPSIGDAYDAPGYWTILQIRGYTLDNRYNYRRDGLPINAETAIALDNKERIEVLKGTSGIQAGTSAPGGLVNLVVKRPVAGQRSASIQLRQQSEVIASADIGDRAGPNGAFGWRVNVAGGRLDPRYRDSEGNRWLAAAALDWQPTPDTLLEAEVESSRQKQPSLAGYSLLGDSVPDARTLDLQRNLNHQPWGQPVVLAGTTASLRLQQRLGVDWRASVHAMTQRLKSDDRTAFPYGKYDADTFACDPCDRYGQDGSFTYWQFVSDDERRTTDALQLAAAGSLRTGPVAHAVELGVLGTRFKARFHDQVFDIAGVGSVFFENDTPPSPGTPSPNTNRSERSTEFFVRDAMRWGPASLWAGVRQTRLRRDSALTAAAGDDHQPTDDRRDATIPFVALAWKLTPQTSVYASWGRGLETAVAPNRPERYANAGQPLPALKSRQSEAGVKHASESLDASVAVFDIDRPVPGDVPSGCSAPPDCRYAIDGGERHRGIEASATWRIAAWTLQAGAMVLGAERHGASDPNIDGARPVNVPVRTLRAAVNYRVGAVPGLDLTAAFRADSDRVALPYDSGKRIGGFAQTDLAARWQQRLDTGVALTWRAGVDNVFDRRTWRESPYQFGHAYLYPLTPRTWRVSAQAAY